jgi:hypothetical protein
MLRNRRARRSKLSVRSRWNGAIGVQVGVRCALEWRARPSVVRSCAVLVRRRALMLATLLTGQAGPVAMRGLQWNIWGEP